MVNNLGATMSLKYSIVLAIPISSVDLVQGREIYLKSINNNLSSPRPDLTFWPTGPTRLQLAKLLSSLKLKPTGLISTEGYKGD